MMSKPIECKKCGKLNKSDATICWHCGSDIQPKMTPKEAIHSEIKFRHEVLHKKRVRNFWIFTSIILVTVFSIILVNSIYGIMRDIKPDDYVSFVTIKTVEDETYIEVEFEGVDLNMTRMNLSSIILENETGKIEIKASKQNPWAVEHAYGIVRARLVITTPVSELMVYDTVSVRFSFLVFSRILEVPQENLFFNE